MVILRFFAHYGKCATSRTASKTFESLQKRYPSDFYRWFFFSLFIDCCTLGNRRYLMYHKDMVGSLILCALSKCLVLNYAKSVFLKSNFSLGFWPKHWTVSNVHGFSLNLLILRWWKFILFKYVDSDHGNFDAKINLILFIRLIIIHIVLRLKNWDE